MARQGAAGIEELVANTRIPLAITACARSRAAGSYGDHSHTKIAPLVTKITYIKMNPRSCIRNGFANGSPTHSHFYAACTSRHEPSMIPKALKFATLQKKMAPIPPHT